jgi:hypothetical protein
VFSYAFCTWLPLRTRLRKELGELLVGMGLVGSALTLFEELELWDSLIVCYQLLDKRVQVGRGAHRVWGCSSGPGPGVVRGAWGNRGAFARGGAAPACARMCRVPPKVESGG